MELLPESLKKEILEKYPFRSTEKLKDIGEATIAVKFFNPFGKGTWYVLEAFEENNTVTFFGFVDLLEGELGYFTLRELETLQIPVRFGNSVAYGKIERDLYMVDDLKLKDVRA